tara:strand:+ start:162 stop:1295 length:1134 start_codon:yes stop_codon:yes gene_type:complete
MKEITLDDLKVLVESLDNNEDIPVKQPEYKTLVEDGVREVQENVKNLYEEIRINQEKIAAEKAELEKKTLIESSVELLPERTEDPLLSDKIDSLAKLQENQKLLINRLQVQLGSLGGGGEVRLEFLDDVDRDSVKVDGKVLSYQASTGKFVGVTNSGGGGGSFSGTDGQILQHNGSEYVGVSSVGLGTFFNDLHQGYYRYSTNYYTTGVANTVQTLPADEFVLVQPSVRTNKVDFLPQKMLDANSNDPWIGAGATIGTGQTQFSLAGLDDGSTVIVRIASQLNPDIDNTNLDFKLEFTTNPTTQGYGTTNFSITREQALICNEGADQNYISETLINFYVGSSLSGPTKATAGSFNVQARASDEGDFEMMALTINVVA